MPKLEINGEPAIIIPKSGWIELSAVLLEFVSRADAGQHARECYSRCMQIVAEANPELKSD